MPQDKITVIGARVHNLKNINVEIPRDKLVVITGLSGSGKSLAGLRHHLRRGPAALRRSRCRPTRASSSGQLDKPDVDQIDGLSPAISIDQKGVSHNPRSTVGTVTEIYDYLRLLFARVGIPHCPVCGREVRQQSAEEIVDAVEALPDGTRIQVLAPLIEAARARTRTCFEDVRKVGLRARARRTATCATIEDEIELDRYKNHTIEAVVDRLVVRARRAARRPRRPAPA